MAILLISLVVILLGAEVFVNGIEWLGKKLNLSEGAVGSVLAAVGTALPETMIPIIAIVLHNKDSGHEIGIGAILGAPLMLSTLAMFVAGLAVLAFSYRRLNGKKMLADYSTMKRDLGFFILVYTSAIIAGTLPPEMRKWQIIIAIILVSIYFIYVYILLSENRNLMNECETAPCYFARKSQDPPLWKVLLQVVFALALIIKGAHLFVGAITEIANNFGVPAFVLALVIAPLATELPEKFNSVIWISRERDTLALGNITGAMVFQGSLIPAVGILLTDWQLSQGAFISGIIALVSASLLYFELRKNQYIHVNYLLFAGIFYALFIVFVFLGIIR